MSHYHLTLINKWYINLKTSPMHAIIASTMTCSTLYCDQQFTKQCLSKLLLTNNVCFRQAEINFLSSIDCSLASAGAISVLTGLANNPDGLKYIALSQCGLTGKTVTYLATMLNDNPCHLSTLSHLDLSQNNLKDDVHVSSHKPFFFYTSLHQLKITLPFFYFRIYTTSSPSPTY